MQDRGLGDLVADAEHRVEAGHRLLEDHRDVAAAELAQRPGRHPGEIDDRAGARAEQDLAAGDAAGRIGDQSHDRQARHRLARAGFADHRQRLARVERERDVLDRPDEAGFGARTACADG